MTTPPVTHSAAREIVRNAELYTLTPEHIGEMLAYVAQAEAVERERDELKAKLTRAPTAGEINAAWQSLIGAGVRKLSAADVERALMAAKALAEVLK